MLLSTPHIKTLNLVRKKFQSKKGSLFWTDLSEHHYIIKLIQGPEHWKRILIDGETASSETEQKTRVEH